jgi:mercuric ion transport protein
VIPTSRTRWTNIARTRFADSAGVAAAIFAALCCAGAPLLVSVLAATGLSFVRRDAILWPLMGIALAVALWGFWESRRVHRLTGPLIVATAGAVMIVAGVILVHGPLAYVLIWAGAAVLVAATVWNILGRMRCGSLSAARH